MSFGVLLTDFNLGRRKSIAVVGRKELTAKPASLPGPSYQGIGVEI